MCLIEKPISSRGAAMGGGGGDGDLVLIGAGTEIRQRQFSTNFRDVLGVRNIP